MARAACRCIACEPAEVGEPGLGLTLQSRRPWTAIALVLETVAELRTDAAYPAP